MYSRAPNDETRASHDDTANIDVDGNPLNSVADVQAPVQRQPSPHAGHGSGRRDSIDYYNTGAGYASSGVKRGREGSPSDDYGRRRRHNSDYSGVGYQDSQYSGHRERDRNSYGGSGSNSYGNYNSGGYNGGGNYQRSMEDPATLPYLVSFRQFCEYLKFKNSGGRGNRNYNSYQQELSDEELRTKFSEYREEFQSRTMWQFYQEHKKEEWFISKYHPKESIPCKEEVYTRKKSESLPHWAEDISSRKFDSLSFDTTATAESTISSDGFAGVELHVPKAWDLHALFIKSVPLPVKRSELVVACKDYPGFKRVLLSDPRSDKNFVRLGWLIFESGTDLDAALAALNGKSINEHFSLSLALQVTHTYRTRILPFEFNGTSRIEVDVANARKLAKSLDLEAGIPFDQGHESVDLAAEDIWLRIGGPNSQNDVASDAAAEQNEMDVLRGATGMMLDGVATSGGAGVATTKGDSNLVKQMKLRLDLFVEYLRRVHWYDYYSGMEADGPEDFLRRSWVYLRSTTASANSSTSTGKQTDFQRLVERLEARVAIRTLNLVPPVATSATGGDGQTQIDASAVWGGSHLLKLGGKDPEGYVSKHLDSFVTEVDEEKFRCSECSKLFRGREFVKKHLRGKHPEIAEVAKLDVEYFNAYVRDPNRVHAPDANNSISVGGSGRGGRDVGQGYYDQGGYGGSRGGYGGGRGRGSNRGGYGGRDGRPLPVDPRSRKTYEDLDVAPVGNVDELNYD